MKIEPLKITQKSTFHLNFFINPQVIKAPFYVSLKTQVKDYLEENATYGVLQPALNHNINSD